MLVEFSMSNYKCFKEEIKFSLIASNYDTSTREKENVIDIPQFNLRLLKSAVIYGANASGKTKLIDGMAFMRHFILKSSKEGQIEDSINVIPFKLSTETENASSVFEAIFIHDDALFRYGFEVDKEKIHSEWLYFRPHKKEIELFYREGQKFEIDNKRFKVSDLIENDRIRPNALLLSVAANWNEKLAKSILKWFNKFNTISGLRDEGYEGFSIMKLRSNKKEKGAILEFLKEADLGIEDISVTQLDVDNLPSDIPQPIQDFIKKRNSEEEGSVFFSEVNSIHKKYDSKNKLIGTTSFSMEAEESSGTKKYFALSGPILETLKKGEILVADELANKLHPNLVCKLIEIFNSIEGNKKNAQLIFNAHDTNLLSSGLFRRDQIWFTEKNRYGASTLYSLNDFKSTEVRKEENYEKNYIKGKYGAIPYLGNFEKLFSFELEDSIVHENEE